jgi:lysozyme
VQQGGFSWNAKIEMADYAKAAKWAALPLSAALLSMTMSMEGNKPTAYPDPGVGWKLPTICVGHTKGVHRGDHATLAQCQQFLTQDMQASGREVARCVTADISEGQFDALVDFQFNTGKLCGSSLVRLLNAGNCHGAAAEFPRWVHGANGIRLDGLLRRRAAERAMFEKDC